MRWSKTVAAQQCILGLSLTISADQFLRRSVEVLLRYLTDRRQKVNKALANLRPANRPSPNASAKAVPASELLALPDRSMLEYDPAQLRCVAQVVDTALLTCYLAIRPSLLGSLCRLENWCEVEEVKELLTNAKVCLVFLPEAADLIATLSLAVQRIARPLSRQSRPC